MYALVAKYWKSLLDLLFPPRCVHCGALSAEPICSACQVQVKRIKGEIKDALFSARTATLYEGPIKKALHALKFERDKSVIAWLERVFIQEGEQCFPAAELSAFSLITAVPLSAKRLRQRGFNQAELLARALAQKAGRPYEQTLCRVKDTKPQFALKREERLKNLHQAFKLKPGVEVRGKKILLVDDIYTTGTTLRECAKVLRVGGAAAVAALTLARAI